jgi:hypothetical protein
LQRTPGEGVLWDAEHLHSLKSELEKGFGTIEHGGYEMVGSRVV